MTQNPLKSDNSTDELQRITTNIYHLAQKHQHDSLFLLSLLRSLESLHRQIRSNMFETSLPETRNDLYNLVKDIEDQGGWPYIERMRLQELLKNMEL